MLRWSVALLLAGNVMFAPPPNVSARCYDVGTPYFRCDPIISDSLKRKSLGLPPRYTPRSSARSRLDGSVYSTPGGASIHRFKYKGPGGTYKGKTTVLPGGSYRHRGSWR